MNELPAVNPIAPVVYINILGFQVLPSPVLENWSFYYGRLAGNIYDDPQGRFTDGRPVITSRIVDMNEAQGWAQTEFTRYRLGMRA